MMLLTGSLRTFSVSHYIYIYNSFLLNKTESDFIRRDEIQISVFRSEYVNIVFTYIMFHCFFSIKLTRSSYFEKWMRL